MPEVISVNNENFDTEVKESDIPVLVDFGADWCGPCKQLEPIIEKLSDEYSGDIKFCEVDVEDSQDLATEFGVMSVPTLMVFENSDLKEQKTGFIPEDKLREFLDQYT